MVSLKELLWALAMSAVLLSPIIGINPAVASFWGLNLLAFGKLVVGGKDA